MIIVCLGLSSASLPLKDLSLFFRYLSSSIGPVGRVFASDPGDRGSISGRVKPKTLKMVLDTSLLNTKQYNVHIESKV